MSMIMDKFKGFEIQFKIKIKSTEQELSLQQDVEKWVIKGICQNQILECDQVFIHGIKSLEI